MSTEFVDKVARLLEVPPDDAEWYLMEYCKHLFGHTSIKSLEGEGAESTARFVKRSGVMEMKRPPAHYPTGGVKVLPTALPPLKKEGSSIKTPPPLPSQCNSSEDSTSLLGGSGTVFESLRGSDEESDGAKTPVSDGVVSGYMKHGAGGPPGYNGVIATFVMGGPKAEEIQRTWMQEEQQTLVVVQNPGRIEELEKQVTDLLNRDYEKTVQFDSLIEGMRRENKRLTKEVKEKDNTIERLGEQLAKQAQLIEGLKAEIEHLKAAASPAAPAASPAAVVHTSIKAAPPPPPPPPPYREANGETTDKPTNKPINSGGLFEQIINGVQLKKTSQPEKKPVQSGGVKLLQDSQAFKNAMQNLARANGHGEKKEQGDDDGGWGDEDEPLPKEVVEAAPAQEAVKTAPPPPPPQPVTGTDWAGAMGSAAMSALEVAARAATDVWRNQAKEPTTGVQTRAGAAAVAPVPAVEHLPVVQEDVEQEPVQGELGVRERPGLKAHRLDGTCNPIRNARKDGKNIGEWERRVFTKGEYCRICWDHMHGPNK